MHTPTPWRQAGKTIERLQGTQRNIEAEFIHLEAEGYTAGGGIGLIHNKPHGVGAANAALIVNAVNSYEAMRAALEGLLDYIGPHDTNIHSMVIEPVRKAREALALAEGKG